MIATSYAPGGERHYRRQGFAILLRPLTVTALQAHTRSPLRLHVDDGSCLRVQGSSWSHGSAAAVIIDGSSWGERGVLTFKSARIRFTPSRPRASTSSCCGGVDGHA